MWPVGCRLPTPDLTHINKYCDEFDVIDGSSDRITREFLKHVGQLAVLNMTESVEKINQNKGLTSKQIINLAYICAK
jgi:hypothetical protein